MVVIRKVVHHRWSITQSDWFLGYWRGLYSSLAP